MGVWKAARSRDKVAKLATLSARAPTALPHRIASCYISHGTNHDILSKFHILPTPVYKHVKQTGSEHIALGLSVW